MRIRITFLFLLAIAMFAVGISLFLVLFFQGESLLPKEIIFISKGDKKIEKYTEITPDNFKDLFEPKEILKAAVNENMVTVDQLDRVMWKAMSSPLYPKDYLTVNHIGENFIVPRDGESGYPIPDSWWEILDWTGRPGDIGELWLTPTEKLKTYYADISTNKSYSFDWVPGQAEDDVQPLKNEKNLKHIVPDLPNRPLSKPFLSEVRIRYISDSSNRAIRNVEGIDDRSEGTGNPSRAKLFLTTQDYAELKLAYEEGYKLIYVAKEGGE